MTDYEKVKSCCWVTGTAGVLWICYNLCGVITSAKKLMDEDLKETIGTAKEAMNDVKKTMANANKTLDSTQSAMHAISCTANKISERGVLGAFFGQ